MRAVQNSKHERVTVRTAEPRARLDTTLKLIKLTFALVSAVQLTLIHLVLQGEDSNGGFCSRATAKHDCRHFVLVKSLFFMLRSVSREKPPLRSSALGYRHIFQVRSHSEVHRQSFIEECVLTAEAAIARVGVAKYFYLSCE